MTLRFGHLTFRRRNPWYAVDMKLAGLHIRSLNHNWEKNSAPVGNPTLPGIGTSLIATVYQSEVISAVSQSVSQSVSLEDRFLLVSWSDINRVLKSRFLRSWGALSDEMAGLSLVRNHSHCQLHIFTYLQFCCVCSIVRVFKPIQQYTVYTWPLSLEACSCRSCFILFTCATVAACLITWTVVHF
jgi:hypothetical protein